MVSNIIPNVSFGKPSINKALELIEGNLLNISAASIKVSTVPGFFICLNIFGFPDSIPTCNPMQPLL